MSGNRWAGTLSSNEWQKGAQPQTMGPIVGVIALLIVAGVVYLVATTDWGVGGRYVKIESPLGATVTVDGDLVGADRRVDDGRTDSLLHSVLLAPGVHTIGVAVRGAEISDDVLVPEEHRREQQWVVVGRGPDGLWLEVQWQPR